MCISLSVIVPGKDGGGRGAGAGAQSLPDNKAANYGETAATTCTKSRMAPDFEAEVGAAEIGMVV